MGAIQITKNSCFFLFSTCLVFSAANFQHTNVGVFININEEGVCIVSCTISKLLFL